jgi:TetR/AcrR family transcriptional regulator, transcriptional repressor of bet genes
MAKQTMAAAGKPGERQLRLRQRQKLIDACISALYLHGPSRTTIDKVVAIADMSPGIVNFYFETKAAMLVAALDHLAVEFEERVLAPLTALRDDPVLALRRLVELYLDPDIASPRKVSVWYAFWGEATSRSEYYAICGKRDEAFADLVRDLVAGLISRNATPHLNADAVALGLIGALEMMWQAIAFHEETDLDRAAARRRCMDYLGSIFPAQFAPDPTRLAGPPNFGAITNTGPHPKSAVANRKPATFSPNDIEAFALLIVAELSLAGVPAISAAGLNSTYQVLAQPPGQEPQRIAVQSSIPKFDKTPESDTQHPFDWLAIPVDPNADTSGRRIFIIPYSVAKEASKKVTSNSATGINQVFGQFENNFTLLPAGRS